MFWLCHLIKSLTENGGLAGRWDDKRITGFMVVDDSIN
jgi:hypothetical protein